MRKIAINTILGSFDLSIAGYYYMYANGYMSPDFIAKTEEEFDYITNKPNPYENSFRKELHGLGNYWGVYPFIRDGKYILKGASLIPRDNSILIKCLEELGENANSEQSFIKIVEIPDDVEWVIICNDNGVEHVAEKHKIWK